MIQGLFRVVADTYHRFIEPQDHPEGSTSSPLALQLLLGGLVIGIHSEFPGECHRIVDSVGLYPHDVDSHSREYESHSPASIFDRLMVIKLELEIAWSAAKDCESKKVTEIMIGDVTECPRASPMKLSMSTKSKTLKSPAATFQADLEEVIQAGGLDLEDYPDFLVGM